MDGNEQEAVTMSEVAAVLSTLARIGAQRDKPRPGDLIGAFDAWFDGGAIRYQTGVTEYHLADGTSVGVLVVTRLELSVVFPESTGPDSVL